MQRCPGRSSAGPSPPTSLARGGQRKQGFVHGVVLSEPKVVRAPLTAMAILAAGCIQPTHAPGYPGPASPPVVVGTDPALDALDVPLNPQLLVFLDRYLDPFSVDPRRALRLSSGAQTLEIDVQWDPVTKAVVARPTAPLRPGVRYLLTLVEPGALADFAGRTIEAPLEVRFTTGERTEVEEAETIDDPRAAVEAYFAGDGRCLECHVKGSRYLALEDLSELAGLAAKTAADRDLVVPGNPSQSYLLHKLLPSYPDLVGGPMPPYTTEGSADRVPPEALSAVARWIETL